MTLDIIFKFGEHYYEKGESSFWQQLIVTIIGFGFTLGLYYLKIRSDRHKDKNAHKKKLNNLLVYYRKLLQTIINNFNKQLEIIEDYIVEQEAKLTELVLLKKVASNDFERLRNIDHEGIFEAWTYRFNDKESIKTYNKVNSSLDFLDGTKGEIHRLFFRNSDKCDAILEEVKKMIQLLADKVHTESFIIRLDEGEERWNNEYFVFLNDSVMKYHELISSYATFEQISNEFITPVINTYLENFVEKKNANEIILLCKNTRVRLNDVKYAMTHIIPEYKGIIEGSKKHIEKIEQIISRLNQDQ